MSKKSGYSTFYTASGKVCLNGYDAYTQLQNDGAVAINGNDPSMQSNRDELIAYSRGFYRNNAIYKGMIDRLVVYTIGTGFTLQMTSKNQAYNQKVEKLWKEYWKKPEIRGLLSGPECERMMMRETFVCGDTGTSLLEDSGLIQMIEAEQIKGSYDWNDSGVKTNKFGVVESFSIAPYSQDGSVDVNSAEPVDYEDFCFVADLARPSAIRGVPISTASFPNLNRLADVLDSEAVSWQLLSRMALSITKQAVDDVGEVGTLDDDYNPPPTSMTPNVTEVEWGTIFSGQPGDEIKSIDRDVPGKNFPESVRMYLRMIGLPMSMPLELLLLDWTKSNYSQAKAVINQFQSIVKVYQELAISNWYNKIFERWLRNEIAKGSFKARTDMGYTWIETEAPQIDPLKESQSDALQVANGHATFAEILKKKAKDPETHKANLLREDIEAELLAEEFKKKTKKEGDPSRYKGQEAAPAYTQPQEPQETETTSKEESNNDTRR